MARPALQFDDAGRKPRLNGTHRPGAAPAQILRQGHFIFKVSDINRSIAWYQKALGLKLSDFVYAGEESNKLIAFLRCDRGAEHTDHHTVGLAQVPPGAPLGVHHASCETLDLDSMGMGAEWLKEKGWDKQHVWGIGRHMLGSQVFDYWRDPFGNMVEHYADGDLFDASVPTTRTTWERNPSTCGGRPCPRSSWNETDHSVVPCNRGVRRPRAGVADEDRQDHRAVAARNRARHHHPAVRRPPRGGMGQAGDRREPSRRRRQRRDGRHGARREGRACLRLGHGHGGHADAAPVQGAAIQHRYRRGAGGDDRHQPDDADGQSRARRQLGGGPGQDGEGPAGQAQLRSAAPQFRAPPRGEMLARRPASSSIPSPTTARSPQ